MRRVEEVVVVVPARNEELLLPGCLDALAAAAEMTPIPVRTIVVADSCTDSTIGICAVRPVETVIVDLANVGQARNAGIAHALRSGAPDASVWIANTDADTRVPPGWISEQVRLADEGADVVLGLATVTFDLPASLRGAYEAAYSRGVRSDGSHGHIHGANFGIRASTYVEAGGFPPLTDHEDRQLVLRVRGMQHPVVVTASHLRVETSGRTDGRCQEGVANSISRMALLSVPPELAPPSATSSEAVSA